MIARAVAKGVVGVAAALSLGVALSTATVTPASAGDGGAIAAGIIGGAAVGAIIGSAAAQPRYYPAPAPYYGPVEYVPPPPPPHCWVENRPVMDPYGYVVGSEPTRVCQ